MTDDSDTENTLKRHKFNQNYKLICRDINVLQNVLLSVHFLCKTDKTKHNGKFTSVFSQTSSPKVLGGSLLNLVQKRSTMSAAFHSLLTEITEYCSVENV